MVEPPTIWLTRPQADSDSLAAELKEHGIDSLIAPVMRIEPQTIMIPKNMPSALLITSRHAAHALAALPIEWRNLAIYCVGGATAKAAKAELCRPRENGLSENQIIVGDADVLTLLPRIATDLPTNSRLLYLSGDETRADVTALLSTHSITVETCVAYNAVAITELPSQLKQALRDKKLNAIALFSPRSALLACELLIQHSLSDAAHTINAYCLSLNVAQAAGTLTWHSLHVCHQPTYTSMVDLIVSDQNKTL